MSGWNGRLVGLVILDGWGVNPKREGNAVRLARTPVMDRLLSSHPSATLTTCGTAVGLPPGQMGNSEVGHLNLGAGRIVYQDLTRIDKAVADGELARNPVLPRRLEAGASGRNASPDRAGLAGRGTQPRATSLRVASARGGGRRAPDPRARVPGRPRHGAPLRREASIEADRIGARGAYPTARSRPFRAASSRWIATSAGTGPRRPTARWFRARDSGAASAVGGARRGVRARRGRRVRDAHGPRGSRRSDPDAGTRSSRSISAPIGCARSRRALADPGFEAFPRPERPTELHYVCMTEYDETFTFPVIFTDEPLRRTIGEVVSQARDPPAPDRGDREVRARHLLLQRQRGDAVLGRGPGPDPVAEGDDLRPEAGDERPRGHGGARAAPPGRPLRFLRPQLRERRHGGAHGRSFGRGARRGDRRHLPRQGDRRGCPRGTGWRS